MTDAGTKATQVLPELLDLLAAGRLKPVVAERIPLLEAARAHKILERGAHAGKVVLVADQAPPATAAPCHRS